MDVHGHGDGDTAAGRRGFFGRVAQGLGALVLGTILVGPLGTITHPWWRKLRGDGPVPDGEGEGWISVGSTGRFKAGGPPSRVVLTEDRRDGWLVRSDAPIGTVLVQRLDEEAFRVFSAVCPHLGCAVGYDRDHGRYRCPCHESAFAVDGQRHLPEDGGTNPSPRGLDPLESRIRGGELEVRWVRYRTGLAERVRAS